MSDTLTPKQEAFCREYVTNGGNATQAAISAGYSTDTARSIACENLTKPDIELRIQAIRAELGKSTGITVEYILNGLKENFERSMQYREVTDKEGNGTGEFVYRGDVANRSLEMMGKHIGMWKDKVEVTGKDGTPIEGSPADRLATVVALLDRARARTSGQASDSNSSGESSSVG